MSKRANPTLIGLFMMGGLVLGTIGLIAFASDNFLRDHTIFISSFRESVNGLSVGAAVKCQGVPVGEVTDLQLLIDLDEETFQVPVYYEIDLDRLNSVIGSGLEWGNEAVLQQHINKGLRAQLQLESIVTGQMYIELRYVDAPEAPQFVQEQSRYSEIPSVFSPMAELGTEATGLVSNLKAFNVNAISENMTALLLKANSKLDELDLVGLNASLSAASESIQELASSEEIKAFLDAGPEISGQLEDTFKNLQHLANRLDSATVAVSAQVGRNSDELNLTLQAVQTSMEKANNMMTTDAGLGFQLQETLISLTEAADALRLLAQSIEQNPSMLIRGKKESDL